MHFGAEISDLNAICSILELKSLIWTVLATFWILDLLFAENSQHLGASICTILFASCLP